MPHEKMNRSISPIGHQDSSFESSDILKPMLLVDIDNKGMMKINRKAIEYLQSIKKNVIHTPFPFLCPSTSL